MSPLRNLQDPSFPQKISGSPEENFRLGGPDPRKGGRGPKLMAALGRDPGVTRNGERTAAISAAVAEKIAIKDFSSAPSSGQTTHLSAPISRTPRPLLEAYIVLKFRVPRPPRTDAIRLFRNLKMPPYRNNDIETGPIYARPRGKSNDDGVG